MDDAERAERVLREVADTLWRTTFDRPVLPTAPRRRYGPLRCAECKQTTREGQGWRALIVDFGATEYDVAYCPSCAGHEGF